ncbi:MAG: hypothetical protein EBQ94_09155 [Flavobacteriales bacterium]|nr:hypothetical protein [Crocinitomicaceae bacterium]NBX80528.1 hypothetical protein [Flavobacteriales bacterium]NCA21616.1 hypothetical protein [Crocinitomicaceae bacterium]
MNSYLILVNSLQSIFVLSNVKSGNKPLSKTCLSVVRTYKNFATSYLLDSKVIVSRI